MNTFQEYNQTTLTIQASHIGKPFFLKSFPSDITVRRKGFFMEFKEYLYYLQKEIESHLYESEELSVTKVTKNNGVVLTGIMVRNRCTNITPTIYADTYFTEDMDHDEIINSAHEILKLSRQNRESFSFDFDKISSFEKVKKALFIKLINKKANTLMLEGVPNKSFLDLSIIVYCDLSKIMDVNGTIMVTNSLLEEWEISEDDMFNVASSNTRLSGKGVMNLYDFVSGATDISRNDEDFMGCNKDIYVLTNKSMTFGAALMTLPDVLNGFCTLYNTNVMIVPSSIHEVLLIPCNEAERATMYENLNEMIYAVNRDALSPSEILSDHAYYYDRDKGFLLNY